MGKRSNKQKRGARDTGLRFPGPFVSSIRKRNVLRWTATSAVGNQSATQGVTVQQIADQISVGTAANASYQLWNSAVRLRRVSIWGAPSTTGAAVSCAVDFEGTAAGSVGDNARHTDTTTGTAQGPVVHARPMKGSPAAQWQGSGNGSPLFSIQCSAGSIVEVEYDGVNTEQAAARIVSNVPAAGVAGVTYQSGLFGLPSVTGMTPVGFTPLA